MATIADSFSVKRGPAKPPISAHPAFPAIVALWFAALLGLGSLVLPVVLLERLVTLTGISSLIPAAAPPLGFTARAAIALSGAIAGAILGLVLARKIAESQATEPKPRFTAETARLCRPISAHEELGDEDIAAGDGSRTVAQKRRALAIDEGDARSAYLEPAPLPGQPVFSPAEILGGLDDPAPGDELVDDAMSQPLDLSDFADEESGSAIDALRSRVFPPVDSQDAEMSEQPIFSIGGDADGFDGVEDRDSAGEPLPFAAPSLRRSLSIEFAPYETDEDGIPDPPAEEPAPHLAIVEPADDVFDDDQAVAERPLGDLGLVQLAARLGASLKKRKAKAAMSGPAALSPAPVALTSAEDFEAVGAEDAARAIADFFAPAGSSEPEAAPIELAVEPANIPMALQGLRLDSEDEEDAFAPSFTLPLAGTEPTDSFAADQADGDEVDEDETEYSSLLAMKNPFARPQEFVRVEEPEPASDAIEPAVTFPAAASPQRPFDPPRNGMNSFPAASPRNPGDAEQSLRDALATLQRMSGAA